MYGAMPKVLAEQVEIPCREFMLYQYLPIKMAGSAEIVREKRLECFDGIIGTVCCDYVGLRGLDAFMRSYVYLTAKRKYQLPGRPFNRPGWHSDGFLTNDINYVWSDGCGTEFNSSRFTLTLDDSVALGEMEAQAEERLSKQYPDNSLLRLDQYCIHRVADTEKPCIRTFVKVSISEDKYDLADNSRNYLIDYNWSLRTRKAERNMPQVKA